MTKAKLITRKTYDVDATYQGSTLVSKVAYGKIPVATAPAANAVRCVTVNGTAAAEKAAKEYAENAAKYSGEFALMGHNITRFLKGAVLKSYELKDLAPINGALSRLALPGLMTKVKLYLEGWGLETRKEKGHIVVTAIIDLKAQSTLCEVMKKVNLISLKTERAPKEKADETAYSPVLERIEKIEESAREKFSKEKERGDKADSDTLQKQGNRAQFAQGASEMLSFLAEYIEAGHDVREVMATAKAAIEAAFKEQAEAAKALAPKSSKIVKAPAK